MYWKNLDNKRVGIWGMGREGQAVRQALSHHAPGATIIEIGEDNTADIKVCDVVVKSPGVSLYRPEIQAALQQGITITSGTNLYFANKKPSVFVVAVTGTKGKSTTSALLAHTLQFMGQSVVLGGNIGKPLLDFVDETPDILVAELSSYQCADFSGRPNIGILTNLYPEHLQWHGSHERYYQDKCRMIRSAERAILNENDKTTKALNPVKNPVWFNAPAGMHVQDDMFYDGETALFPVSCLTAPGIHNAWNACAVLAVVKELGFEPCRCATPFSTFQPLPHRLQILGTMHGLTYVDDSISTTPETAMAALRALDRGGDITLLAGGFDRGQDYTNLVALMKEHRDKWRLVTLPDTGTRLGQMAQQAGIETVPTSDMPTAVSIAQHITPIGGVILLSPAAPSYNMYRNFEERGLDFKHWSGV